MPISGMKVSVPPNPARATDCPPDFRKLPSELRADGEESASKHAKRCRVPWRLHDVAKSFVTVRFATLKLFCVNKTIYWTGEKQPKVDARTVARTKADSLRF